jgi:hypothetical protein
MKPKKRNSAMKHRLSMEQVIKGTGIKGMMQRVHAIPGDEILEAIAGAGGITVEALNRDFSDEQREYLWDIFRHGLRIIH